MAIYRHVRSLLFRADPERVHDATLRAAELASASPAVCRAARALAGEPDARLRIDVAGIAFQTPLGLAAGFDKSARAVPFLGALGFGHVEVGSISADPSAGNPRPRLFRLPADRGIVVAYGVPNDGSERIAQRLAAMPRGVPLGVNVVSTNRGPAAASESDEDVVADYVRTVGRLQRHADYLCLNLSCPNTRDGRGFFADPARLRLLLDALGAQGVERPLLLKVAPFADEAAVDAFLAAVEPAPFVSGFSVNLPPGKPAGLLTPADVVARMPGAVSGKPAERLALETVGELYRRMDRSRYVVVGSGGVSTAEDAYRMIRQGASLVQVMTALIYEGPGVVRAIGAGLARLLERDGYASVGEAVGSGVAEPLAARA